MGQNLSIHTQVVKCSASSFARANGNSRHRKKKEKSLISTLQLYNYPGITSINVLWKSYVALLRDHFGQCAVEELSCATQGSLWPVCCGRAKLRYSGITLASVLWKSYVALLRDHFGQWAVEELSYAIQGSLWPVCCGRAKLRYSGITLASVLWKS